MKPEHSLEEMMLKLKLQYFVYLMVRAESWEKILMLGKTEGKRKRGQQRMRKLDGITDSMDMNLSKFWKIVKGRQGWHAEVHKVTVRHDLVTEQHIKYLRLFILSNFPVFLLLYQPIAYKSVCFVINTLALPVINESFSFPWN